MKKSTLKISFKRKILYLITQSELGGAQRYVADLARNLNKERFDVYLAAGGDGWLFAQLKHGQKFHLKRLVREVRPIKDLLAFLELYKLIKKIKPDVVHLNSSKAGVIGAIAAKFAGVEKVIYTAHGFVFLEPMRAWQRRLYIWAESLSSKFKDTIICVSDFDLKEGIMRKIAQRSKFINIHNGVDVDELKFLEKDEARKKILEGQRGATTGFPIIGTINNLYKAKGLQYFIEAAKMVSNQYPNARFIVIGEGQERKKLEVLIKKYQLKNFYLVGAIPDASQYLKAFDIYVSSSIKEGFPYSILEAMAARLPIISTHVGGIPEMLKEMCGILVQPRSPQDLAKCIIHLIQNKKHSRTLGENARKKVEGECNIKNMLEKTYKLYS